MIFSKKRQEPKGKVKTRLELRSLAPAYYVSNYGRIYSTLYHKLIQLVTSNGYARVFLKDLATNQFRHYEVDKLRFLLGNTKDSRLAMVGTAGFEPTSAGVKVLCLTTWLYPSIFVLLGCKRERGK